MRNVSFTRQKIGRDGLWRNVSTQYFEEKYLLYVLLRGIRMPIWGQKHDLMINHIHAKRTGNLP